MSQNEYIIKSCFGNVTEKEMFCGEMIISIIVYGGMNAYYENQYLTEYYKTLGKKHVLNMYETLENYILNNYTINKNTYIDNENVSYNSITRRK